MASPGENLSQACTNLTKQFLHRYGAPMFRKICGESSAYATEMSACFKRAGLTGQEISSLQAWLISGVKAFAEYPPTFEMMVQMGKMIKNFPITDAQLKHADFWLKVDAIFTQNYGRLWKVDNVIDSLQRERVWLGAFEEMDALPSEMENTLKMIRECVAFRSYPPSLEQFRDGLTALRSDNAPLVEDAWLQAISMRPGQAFHPLVKRARGSIGAFDLNVGERDRATEQRFKAVYLSLLKNPPTELMLPAQEASLTRSEYVDATCIIAEL